MMLAFETSCDDTAVALVDANFVVHGEAVFSQLAEHEQFGGVVPEIGSRAHVAQIIHATKQVFLQAKMMPQDVDATAATFAPGLSGPLLVGAQFAKGFALAHSLPLIAVHHIEGHIFSGLGDEGFPKPPFIALIVSGGHTAMYSCDENFLIKTIGETLDDAAGEAFDKIGRALGLSYPAGKFMDELSLGGDATRFALPIAMRSKDHCNFSFSGFKTKALEIIKQQLVHSHQDRADFCASICETIAQTLCERALLALKKYNYPALVLGGGVAANSRLRSMLTAACQEQGISLYLPAKKRCVDNAVMIANAAQLRFSQGRRSFYNTDVLATLPIENARLLDSE